MDSSQVLPDEDAGLIETTSLHSNEASMDEMLEKAAMRAEQKEAEKKRLIVTKIIASYGNEIRGFFNRRLVIDLDNIPPGAFSNLADPSYQKALQVSIMKEMRTSKLSDNEMGKARATMKEMVQAAKRDLSEQETWNLDREIADRLEELLRDLKQNCFIPSLGLGIKLRPTDTEDWIEEADYDMLLGGLICNLAGGIMMDKRVHEYYQNDIEKAQISTTELERISSSKEGVKEGLVAESVAKKTIPRLHESAEVEDIGALGKDGGSKETLTSSSDEDATDESQQELSKEEEKLIKTKAQLLYDIGLSYGDRIYALPHHRLDIVIEDVPSQKLSQRRYALYQKETHEKTVNEMRTFMIQEKQASKADDEIIEKAKHQLTKERKRRDRRVAEAQLRDLTEFLRDSSFSRESGFGLKLIFNGSGPWLSVEDQRLILKSAICHQFRYSIAAGQPDVKRGEISKQRPLFDRIICRIWDNLGDVVAENDPPDSHEESETKGDEGAGQEVREKR
ncbi:MAG: hypothetical protein Q9222_002405 [Ikaeria aurantiellina]